MQTMKGTGKMALNGVCYEKKYNVWCVTSTRIQKIHRRISQRLFDSDKAAVKYMCGIEEFFKGRNPEAELTKNDWLQTASGEVRKCNHTYTFGGNSWDKQIFHLKKVNVLDICEEDGEADDVNITVFDMRHRLESLNYSKEYLDGLDDTSVTDLYTDEFGSDDEED